jgi:hypothetical protein
VASYKHCHEASGRQFLDETSGYKVLKKDSVLQSQFIKYDNSADNAPYRYKLLKKDSVLQSQFMEYDNSADNAPYRYNILTIDKLP